MLLSVIVPCYNVGPQIGALLQAITAQMADDCELILVNDGSTDQTAQHINDFLASYAGAAQVVFKTTANAGAARAREYGLSLARGDYIYFCDSDDLFEPQFIATFRRNLADQPGMDLLFFSSDVVVEDSGVLRKVAPKLSYARTHVFTHGSELLSHNLKHGIYTAAVWTFVAQRALIQASGAAFTPRKAHEDHLYTLRVIMGARHIVAIPEVLYRQKIRAGSLTQSKKNIGYLVDRIDAYREADDFLRSCGFSGRGLYGRWSLGGMRAILKENRALLLPVLLSPAGATMMLLAVRSSLSR